MARAKAAYIPPTPQRLREVLVGFRFTSSSERDVRDEFARVLGQRGIRFDRNVLLSTKGEARADFLVGRIAVAVVLDGSPAERLGELARWTRANAVLLVARRTPGAPSFPAKVGRKPLLVVTVGGA